MKQETRRNRVGGFTLVEVMITIVVASVLGGALLTLVVGQQRFYTTSDNALLAQQNVRAAVDLVAAELRMASPEDIVRAQSDSVVVRFDLMRAVVCDTLGGGQADIFVYDSVTNANLVSSFRGTAYSGPYDSAFVYGDSFTPTVASTGGTAQTNCRNNGADPNGTAASGDFRRTSGWAAEYGITPLRGSLVRWYGLLSYRFGASTSVSGSDAIWRNNQELVSPFESGAQFQYVMASGSVQNSVSGPNLDKIREIRVVVIATGEGSAFNVRRPVTYDIPLRN
jgi:prepilin-type N-terminal cleavage/methylation domain-containing protein